MLEVLEVLEALEPEVLVVLEPEGLLQVPEVELEIYRTVIAEVQPESEVLEVELEPEVLEPEELEMESEVLEEKEEPQEQFEGEELEVLELEVLDILQPELAEELKLPEGPGPGARREAEGRLLPRDLHAKDSHTGRWGRTAL